MTERVSRRRLLAGVGVAAAGALAGCSTAAGSSTSRLAYVRVANWHAQPHTVHVLVERDGDLVHWSSHDLSARGDDIVTQPVDRTWADEQAEFVVRVRVDDARQWKVFDVAGREGNCYGVEARVDEAGRTGIWYEQSPRQCRTSTQEPSNG
jgi:hypothetical protein